MPAKNNPARNHASIKRGLAVLCTAFVLAGCTPDKPEPAKPDAAAPPSRTLPSPQSRRLRGQVFIVTKGAESIKMGLVKVFLLDEESVSNFLKKAGTSLDTQVAMAAEGLRRAEDNLNAANLELEHFDETNVTTQAQFLNIKEQYDNLTHEAAEWDKQSKVFGSL